MRKYAAAALIGIGTGIGMIATGCSGGSDGPPGAAADRSAGTSTTVEARTAAVGDKVELPNGSSVEVHGYEGDITPSNPFSKARAGTTFGAVDVEACAGGEPSPEGVVNPFDFLLVMPDGARIQSSIPVKDPGLGVAPLEPGQCTRGFVTYEVAAGATPTAVAFERPGVNVTWRVA